MHFYMNWQFLTMKACCNYVVVLTTTPWCQWAPLRHTSCLLKLFYFLSLKNFCLPHIFCILFYLTHPTLVISYGKIISKQDFDDVRCFFCICCLAASRPILGYSQGDSLRNLILITAFQLFWPKAHREPCNEVGSVSPAKHLEGFEPGTFQFLSHCLNPLGYSHSHSFFTKRQHTTIQSMTPWGDTGTCPTLLC